LLSFACVAPAQFSGLAPTDDGSQLYFVATVRLASEVSQNLPATTTAIYRIQAGAIQRITVPSPYSVGSPDLYQGNAQVSGDGSVFSYTEYQACVGGSSCITRPTTSDSPLTVGGKAYGTPLAGAAQISRNGRFVYNALIFPAFSFPAGANAVELHDLQTGTTVQPPVQPASSRQAVTSDGRVLGFDPQTEALILWSTSGAQSLTTSEPPATAIINDAGTWVIYQTAQILATYHLRALQLSNGRDVLLASSAAPFDASISSDGNLVAYLNVPGIGQVAQVLTIHPDATGNAPLTSFPLPVDEAVIAGGGGMVFAVTGSRVVAIDSLSGAVQELISPTPVCNAGFVSLIPGSILPIRGSGLTDFTQVAPVPLPSALDGVRVLAGGNPLPILSISPGEVWFQVPFELATGATISVGLDNSSVFAGCRAVTVPVVERDPYFFVSDMLIAAHQDWGSLVASNSPAQPGEVIHTYAVGLGAVTPAMATGIPAPPGGVFPLAGPFDCYVGYGTAGQPLPVVFAGLAPGMIGIYQVDIMIPNVPGSAGWIFVNCGTPGNALERSGGGLPVVSSQ
jgi:uncharacterized protein (TIGR03437 family)